MNEAVPAIDSGDTAWMSFKWAAHGKPSALGAATGAIAGFVAITSASATAGPAGALLIGVTAGALCFPAATRLKRLLRYDDSLDVFGVHAVGGIVGALITGVCAGALGGSGLAAGVTIGARVSPEQEVEGLDLALHDERAYHH